MKKVLMLAVVATALLAAPGGKIRPMMGDVNSTMRPMMQDGNGSMRPMMQCKDPMEQLNLTDEQKLKVKALREEGKAFHEQQHQKMMAILTTEQKAKLKEARQQQMPPMMGHGDDNQRGCPMMDRQ